MIEKVLSFQFELSAVSYADEGVKAANMMVVNGRKRATVVGLLEIGTAVAGLVITGDSLLYYILIALLGGMGLFSLAYYYLIFPSGVRKKLMNDFKTKQVGGDGRMVTDIVMTFDGVTVREVTDKLEVSLNMTEGGVWDTGSAYVLTWNSHTSVLPKSAIVDRVEFEEYLEDIRDLR